MRSIDEIMAPVKPELKRVEELVMDNLETDIPLLTEVGQYILKSGGKRVRPALLLLSSAAFGFRGDEACKAANVIEYIHTATLLHDDVVDNADMRRNKKSAKSIWGNEASVLVGDYLFTVSFQYLAEFKNIKVIDALSRSTTMMARGEILQLTRSYEDATESEYLEIVLHKTASLMGAAMEIGGILGGANEEEQKALYDCGVNIGIAFQMIDDALDYEFDNENVGKDHGTDLKERKITLPLSHLLESADAEDEETILDILDEETITDEHVKTVGALIKKYGSADYTKKEAERYVAKAKEAISILTSSEYTKSIEEIADFVLYRNK